MQWISHGAWDITLRPAAGPHPASGDLSSACPSASWKASVKKESEEALDETLGRWRCAACESGLCTCAGWIA
jgi:hypothetical protein